MLPPRYLLVGASRWLRLLGRSSPESALAIFSADPAYSDLTQANYRESYEWLTRTGLIALAGPDVDSATAVFEGALAATNAPWMLGDIREFPSPELLPEPILSSAEALGIDPTTAWARAIAVGGKLDLERRAEVGSLGEKALVLALRDAGVRTRHASLENDGLGWDVEAEWPGNRRHIEVKTTTSRARLRIYLSRNEFEVSRLDADWVLMIVLISEEGELCRVATVRSVFIEDRVPNDQHPAGSWQSCALDLPAAALLPGLQLIPDSPLSGGILGADEAPLWWPSSTLT